MPTLTRKSRPSFWDRVARKYAKRQIADVPAYETTMARTRAFLSPTDRVLELGCGTSSTALLLASDVAHVTASDMSAEMIEIGREKVWDSGVKNVTPVQGVIGDPDLDGTFDAILAYNLLHLVPDVDAVISRAIEQLPSGGHFISKTPCLGDGPFFLRPMVAVLRRWHGLEHVGFFTRAGLEQMFTRAGFEIIETGDYPRKPPSHFIVARKP